MSLLSRRTFVSSGFMAGAVAWLPSSLFAAGISGGQSETDISSVGSHIGALSLSSPQAVAAMNGVFPGLLQDLGFQQIRPLAFLVANLSKQPIRAFSSSWTVASSAGTYRNDHLHYFRPHVGRQQNMHWGIKGNKTRVTGALPVLKVGGVRLLTPFFNWSPAFYAKNPHVEWTTLLARRARPGLDVTALAQPGATVSMTIDAAILHTLAAIGPKAKPLARTFGITRNAEHDEAIAMLNAKAAGVSDAKLMSLLRHHASGMAFDITPKSDLYYRVRQRQAKVLLQRLQYGRPDQFVRTLNYLQRIPPAVVPSA